MPIQKISPHPDEQKGTTLRQSGCLCKVCHEQSKGNKGISLQKL